MALEDQDLYVNEVHLRGKISDTRLFKGKNQNPHVLFRVYTDKNVYHLCIAWGAAAVDIKSNFERGSIIEVWGRLDEWRIRDCDDKWWTETKVSVEKYIGFEDDGNGGVVPFEDGVDDEEILY